MDDFRRITLFNVYLKILAKIQATRLALVISKLDDKLQTCAVPGRIIYENLRLRCYILTCIIKENGMGGAWFNLNRWKALDRVDQCYMDVVLRGIGFGSVFRG